MTNAPLPPSAAAADLERAGQQALRATEAYAAQLDGYRDRLAACDRRPAFPRRSRRRFRPRRPRCAGQRPRSAPPKAASPAPRTS